MKYFLDSAKIEEIKEAYHTFGIDGVTTNPRHIMVSGKPFLTVISEMADWVKAEGIEGYEKFPISVEINPHLDDADEMVAEARKISAICSKLCYQDSVHRGRYSGSKKTRGRGNQNKCDTRILTSTGYSAGKE